MLAFRKMPVAPSDALEERLRAAERTIAIHGDAIPKNYVQRNFEYVARNSRHAIGLRLDRLALLYRARKDKAAAKAELAATTVFLDHLEDAIAKCNAGGFTDRNFIYVLNLTSPFLACLLANDRQRVERLAAATRLPVVQEEGLEGESGGGHDEIAKMLAAVVLDDAGAFNHLRARFHADRKRDRFWETYFNYDVLMDLVLRRDAPAFNRALAEQEASFKARATDKNAVSKAVLDACGEINALVFDVWAVALGNLARHKQLEVTYSSEIIPLNDFASA
jgi:hypothetical protein